MKDKNTPFFVGYLHVPRGLGGFLLLVCGALIATFAVTGVLIGSTQDAPPPSGFRFDYGRQTVTGVVELMPYPILRVTTGNDLIQPGKSIMLTGNGKNGVIDRARDLDGKLATISGVILQRGTMDMMQLRAGRNGLKASEGDAPAMDTEHLGRWQLAGEICDGKCLYGAMRPGRGLAHKACANLCLLGDIPPIFVSAQPVEGSDFMLITGPDGTKLPDAAYDYIGQFVILDGDLERRGDILVLRMLPETLKLVD